jgi:WXG100 family type VII secretion target
MRIMMTPQEMYDAANFMRARLEAITSEMNDLKNRVDDTMSRWEGKAKDAYCPMFAQAHTQVQNALTESITGLSQAIDESARAIEETDASIAGAFKG